MYSIIVTIHDPILSQCVSFLKFLGARKLEYRLTWVKWMDLSYQKLTRNYSSNASKQHIIIIEHHITPVHPSRTHQLMSTPSIYALVWERYLFQFIMIPSKAVVFLFRTYFSLIRKRTGRTSSILSLNTDLTL